MSDNDPNSPNSNGGNGEGDRDARGRFLPGNCGGPGNPVARHAHEIRRRLNDALYKSCSPDRLLAATDSLLKLAEAGDVQAMKLLAELIKWMSDQDHEERIRELEERAFGKDHHHALE